VDDGPHRLKGRSTAKAGLDPAHPAQALRRSGFHPLDHEMDHPVELGARIAGIPSYSADPTTASGQINLNGAQISRARNRRRYR
jgi:hypothetical protein